MKHRIKCCVDVREHLRGRGFCRIRSADYIIPPNLMAALRALVDECQDLPVDPRADNGERRRRYGRFVYLPWADMLLFRPVTTYYQDVALNSADGGVTRQFASLTSTLQGNPFLHELIRFDFGQLPLAAEELALPWDVGIHLIEMVARPDKPGIASPDRAHKDSEPFTYVHVLHKENVTGGISAVYGNADVNGKLVPGDLLFEDTLDGLMETIGVKDDLVFHQVKRIEVVFGATEGRRLVLLVDFTPMVPKRNEYPNLA